jgi:WD40 repeat protein
VPIGVWCGIALGGVALLVLVGLAVLLLRRPGTESVARTAPVVEPQHPPARQEAPVAVTRPPDPVTTRSQEEAAALAARKREAEAARQQEIAAEAARRKEEQARADKARALADYDAAMVSGDIASRGRRFEEAVRHYTTALKVLADAEPLLGQDADSASRKTRATEARARAEKARAIADAEPPAGQDVYRDKQKTLALARKNTAQLHVALGLSRPPDGEAGAVTGTDTPGVPTAPAPVEGITRLVTAKIGTLEDTSLSPRQSVFSLVFQQASFSPDGRYLFTNAGKSPVKVQFWSVPDLQPVFEVAGGRWAQPPPLYHPQMHTVAATIYGSESKTGKNVADAVPATRLWSVPDWKLKATLNRVAASAVSPDGRYLVGMDERRLGLWSLPDGNFVKYLLPEAGTVANWPVVLGFHPSRPLLAVESPLRPEEFVWTPELKQLDRKYNKNNNARFFQKISLWSVPDGNLITTLPGAHGFADFSPDGRTLACYGPRGGVQLWSVPEGDLLATFGDEDTNLPDVRSWRGALSPDGRYVAFANKRNTRLWSVRDGKLTATIPAHAAECSCYSISFSPDGRLLATSADSGDTCRLWSVPGGKLLATLYDYGEETEKGAEHTKHRTGIVAFSPDGRTLATHEAGGTSVWLYAEGDQLDWTPDEAAPGRKPRGAATLPGAVGVYAGDRVRLDLTLRNQGNADWTQLWAGAESDSPQLRRLGCLLGRVKAGETVQRRLGVVVPVEHAPGTIAGTLVFRQGKDKGNAPAAVPFAVEVKPLPRPDFVLRTTPEDLSSTTSPIRLKRGETLEVPFTVRNGTGETIRGLQVTLRVVKGDAGVILTRDLAGLADVRHEGTAAGRVALQARLDGRAAAVSLELRAEDAGGRVFAVRQFTVPID